MGLRERVLTPEILDDLPETDPRALRSRRDLRLINYLMGNYRWIASRLASEGNDRTWVELGAGDGSLGRFSEEISVEVVGIDFAGRPRAWPEEWDWISGDLWSTILGDDFFAFGSGVIANLFLHHFTDDQLRKLGSCLRQKCSRFLVVEPARFQRFTLLGSLLYPLVNDVTRHDMRVSIEGGFRPPELVDLLGLHEGWRVEESVSLFGAYRLEAWREVAAD